MKRNAERRRMYEVPAIADATLRNLLETPPSPDAVLFKGDIPICESCSPLAARVRTQLGMHHVVAPE